jgi:DNA anti-recombination protein RmuC
MPEDAKTDLMPPYTMEDAQVDALTAGAVAALAAARLDAVQKLDDHAGTVREVVARETARAQALLDDLAQRHHDFLAAMQAQQDHAVAQIHAAQQYAIDALHSAAQALASQLQESGQSSADHLRISGDQIGQHLATTADHLSRQVSQVAEQAAEQIQHVRDQALDQLHAHATLAGDAAQHPAAIAMPTLGDKTAKGV